VANFGFVPHRAGAATPPGHRQQAKTGLGAGAAAGGAVTEKQRRELYAKWYVSLFRYIDFNCSISFSHHTCFLPLASLQAVHRGRRVLHGAPRPQGGCGPQRPQRRLRGRRGGGVVAAGPARGASDAPGGHGGGDARRRGGGGLRDRCGDGRVLPAHAGTGGRCSGNGFFRQSYHLSLHFIFLYVLVTVWSVLVRGPGCGPLPGAVPLGDGRVPAPRAHAQGPARVRTQFREKFRNL
jgi:hypothetical protein